MHPADVGSQAGRRLEVHSADCQQGPLHRSHASGKFEALFALSAASAIGISHRKSSLEGSMIDSWIRASGNSASFWEIEEASADGKLLGQIVQAPDGFFIFAGKDSLLEKTQISRGPYSSRHDAMDAIAEKLGGFCTLVLGGKTSYTQS
jgi:hypothetical protein